MGFCKNLFWEEEEMSWESEEETAQKCRKEGKTSPHVERAAKIFVQLNIIRA